MDTMTAVFLVNAVYFKDKWRYPFNSEHTFAGEFHITEGESVKCDMMMLSENNSDQFRSVELSTDGIALCLGV